MDDPEVASVEALVEERRSPLAVTGVVGAVTAVAIVDIDATVSIVAIVFNVSER
jgi:hypothetical protein